MKTHSSSRACNQQPQTLQFGLLRGAIILSAMLCVLLVSSAPAHASPVDLTLSESVSFSSNAPNNLSVILPDHFSLTYTVVATDVGTGPLILNFGDVSNVFYSGDFSDLATLTTTNDQCAGAGSVTLTPISPFSLANPAPTFTCSVTQNWQTPTPAFNSSSVVEIFSLQVSTLAQSTASRITVDISDPKQIIPTPEPATFLLFGSGLLALGLLGAPCAKSGWHRLRAEN
jgi:hypothetical protein